MTGGTRRIAGALRRRLAVRPSPDRPLHLPVTFDHDGLGGAFRIALVTDRPDYFGPYMVALAEELDQAGAAATVHGADDELPGGEAAVLIGLHRFGAERLRELRRSRVLAGIQTEQLATPLQGAPRFGRRRLPNVLAALPHVDVVLDWSRENVRLLRAHHPAVAFVPYGFIEADLHPAHVTDEPAYDLAFLGNVEALTGRRRNILDALAGRFAVHPNVDDAWGAEKFAVFAQARIVLNLHVEASAVFEAPRFFDVLGARRPLLSEPVHDPSPFRAGYDFVEASILRLADQVDRLLDDEPLRRRLADTGRATAEANGLEVTAAALLRQLLIAHHGRSAASP